jgi:YfiH family protein
VFYWRGESSRVRSAFTDREGGVSVDAFDSLNLGGHVGDDPRAVEENRTRVAGALGLERDRLLFLDQCHGTDVLVADGPWPDGGPTPADGVVTTEPGLALAVLVADCTPVLLADAAAGVVGAVHAGRPGMTAGIVGVAVERMRELGARDLTAVVGPSVCGRCYEVPAQLRAEAAAVAPESATVSWTGTPAIDVAAGVVAQLSAAEVRVTWLPGCAREDRNLYSYRRDGRTGRFAGVVVLDAA